MLVCGWYQCVIELVSLPRHAYQYMDMVVSSYSRNVVSGMCVCLFMCALHLNIAVRYVYRVCNMSAHVCITYLYTPI